MDEPIQSTTQLFREAVQRDMAAVWYQSSSTLVTALITALVVLVISLGVCRIIPNLRDKVGIGAGVAFIAALIGFLTGHVTGNSRIAITGDITPVLLAGMAGIFVLSLSHEHLNTALAGIFVASFGLSFFQGATLGSHHRNLTTMAVAQAAAAKELQIENSPKLDLGMRPLPPTTTVPLSPQFIPTLPQTFIPKNPFTNPGTFMPSPNSGPILVIPQDSSFWKNAIRGHDG